jgi:ribonucleoside-diphosphate reductase beta chain
MTNQEPITRQDNDRYSLFPIKHLNLWNAYKNHFNCMWSADEIDFSIDKKEWANLSSNEKFFLENILAFFNSSDVIVLDNLITNMISQITVPEARCFYSLQMMMENVHSEVYSLLIDNFIDDGYKKMKLFHAMENIPIVKKKSEWAIKWISNNKNDGKDLARKMFAFAVVEGLFFSGSFCAIFYFKEKGILLNSLCKSNEWISRDEGLHTAFAIMMYNDMIENKLDEEEAIQIMKDAVEIETEFVCSSLPVAMIGMDQEKMSSYIRFVADKLLYSFHYKQVFGDKNPFPWMMKINLDAKTNFFEQRVSEYSIAQTEKNNFDCLSNLKNEEF